MKIFTDNFGSLLNQKDIDIAVKKYPHYDQPYIVASGPFNEDGKEFIENLWKKYEPYADKGFLKIMKLSGEFISRCWEMYVTCLFLEQGFNLNPKQSSDGPDVQIIQNGKNIWIEAISLTPGEGPDKVPNMLYGVADNLPEEKMLLRLSHGLITKLEQHNKHIKDGLVKEDEPFVIAISKGTIQQPGSGIIPLIVKCLFGIGHLALKFPMKDGIPIRDAKPTTSWTSLKEIPKKKGTNVPMTFFGYPEHSGVSAVLYSENHILNHPLKLGADCVFVHNPNAKNPLPTGWLKVGLEHFPKGKLMLEKDRGFVSTRFSEIRNKEQN